MHRSDSADRLADWILSGITAQQRRPEPTSHDHAIERTMKIPIAPDCEGAAWPPTRHTAQPKRARISPTQPTMVITRPVNSAQADGPQAVLHPQPDINPDDSLETLWQTGHQSTRDEGQHPEAQGVRDLIRDHPIWRRCKASLLCRSQLRLNALNRSPRPKNTDAVRSGSSNSYVNFAKGLANSTVFVPLTPCGIWRDVCIPTVDGTPG